MGFLVLAGALRDGWRRRGGTRGQMGGWVGGGSGGGGILNISLFGGIEPAMRPNGVFFGLFSVIFDLFGKTGVLAILAICRFVESTKSNFRFKILICQIKIKFIL